MKRLLAPLFLTMCAWADGLLEVTPDRVEFGVVEAGKLSKPKTIKVKNIHTGDVVFGSVNIGGRDFLDFRIGKDLCSYTILKPGATCEVEVFFQPRPIPKKDEEKKRKEIQLTKEGLFVIPLSELPDLERTWKVAVPLTGTALIRDKKD